MLFRGAAAPHITPPRHPRPGVRLASHCSVCQLFQNSRWPRKQQPECPTPDLPKTRLPATKSWCSSQPASSGLLGLLSSVAAMAAAAGRHCQRGHRATPVLGGRSSNCKDDQRPLAPHKVRTAVPPYFWYQIGPCELRQSIHFTLKTSSISPAGTVIHSSLNGIRSPYVFRRRPATPKCRGVAQTSPIARCAAVARTRAISTFCIPSPNANFVGGFEVRRKVHSVDFS